jgi:hypothetical protein
VKPEDTPERDEIIAKINNDDDGSGSAAAAIPAPAGAADDVVGAPVKD